MSESSSSKSEHPAHDSKGDVDTVRSHYNKISKQAAAPNFEASLNNRSQCRIVQLRNFNNWMKSCLIQDYIERVKSRFGNDLSGLDICCGKGGDLQKWRAAGMRKLVCADLSEVSIEQCEQRYNELRDNARRRPFNQRSGGDALFDAEFHVADCGRVRLSDVYRRPDTNFHIVSCQFSLHYTFETFEQADMMMRNCSESLRRGGYFVCTVPNSNEIVRRCRLGAPPTASSNAEHDVTKSNSEPAHAKAPSGSAAASDADAPFGTWHNEVANIGFANPANLVEPKQPPLFGARYSFYLEDVVVDCPEFLIHIPLLQKLASRHGLRMVLCERFDTYFTRKCRDSNNYELLERIRALQPFSLVDSGMRRDLRFDEHTNYAHAVAHLHQTRQYAVRTMSKAEWDVATLYMVVGFEKTEDHVVFDRLNTVTAPAPAPTPAASSSSEESASKRAKLA